MSNRLSGGEGAHRSRRQIVYTSSAGNVGKIKKRVNSKKKTSKALF